MPCHSFLALALMAAALVSVAAQTKPAKSEQANIPVDKTAAEIEAERLLRERRANAQSLLINLAVDARNFNDARVRARTQARIADALWDADPDRSRALFRSAWDAAEIADAESQQRVQEDIRQQQARTGHGGYAINSPPDLRREVLRLAVKHDSKLGQEFLANYKEQKTREPTDERNRRKNSADEATMQRFSVAQEMMSNGDPAGAMELADAVLKSINVQSVDFLARLRQKDAAAADQRYAAMLANAPADPQADANTVSLLLSYVHAPNIYVMFQGIGASVTLTGNTATPPNISPELRAAFLKTAATILLRPSADQTTAGRDGQYLSLKRMMPFFEQSAPPELTAALKAQLESLAASASVRARNYNDEWLRRGIEADGTGRPERQAVEPESRRTEPGKPVVDREQSLSEQVDRAKTPAERDQLNLQLAMLMIDKDDRRAHDYLDKIDDSELRDSARKYIDASIAWKVLQKRDIDRALELARNGDLSHFQKAWLLAGAARALAVKPNDRDRALTIIEDAAVEARRIADSDPDRARVFVAIANYLMILNPGAMWDILDEVVRAANNAETFTGEDGEISFSLTSKGTNSVHQHLFSDFDLAGVFTKLANQDYDRAVSLAGSFQRPAPRAAATLAIARAALEEKKN